MAEEQRQFYEQQYQSNEYASGIEQRDETEALLKFIETYDLQNKKVLEIGCGRGAFQHLVDDYVGIDLAASVASFLIKPFVAGLAEEIPFADRSFDAIWSIAVLEHGLHPERALQEIVRVLKPRGVAYLAPAWHCRSWAAEGYQVRPWSDFGLKGKIIKFSVPFRDVLWFRAACTMPVRMMREALFQWKRKRPMTFRYRKLKANYETFWTSDSDACNAMDPHEMLLWFLSRGLSTPSHGTLLARFLVRHGAIVVQKDQL